MPTEVIKTLERSSEELENLIAQLPEGSPERKGAEYILEDIQRLLADHA